MNATTLALGSNVFVSAANIQIGNSTANISANSILITLANSTGIANLQPTQLVIGNATINTTVASVGANVLIDTARIFLGNSTVNSMANSVLIKIANSSGIANLQPTQFLIGNAIVNSTAVAVGANVVINTTAVFIGNSTANAFANSILVQVSNSTGVSNLTSTDLTIGQTVVNSLAVTVGANLFINAIRFSVGNTTVNTIANSLGVMTSNSSGITNVNPGSIVTGNSTVFCNVGVVGISLTGSNTLNLGSGSKSAAANGYTFLPNGLILQWGWVAANATAGNITFPVAFPTAVFSYQAVSNSAVAANTVAIIAANTTTMNVRSTSIAAASNSFWLAIGN
jgi:hypothetical protein